MQTNTDHRVDYRVKSVSAKSVRGGSPDNTANRLLVEFGFEPAKGEPEHLLHANAVPKADFKDCYELRVEEGLRGRRGRIWFVYLPEGKERLIDEGRILDLQKLHPKSSDWTISMEGRVLAEWKIHGPRLDQDSHTENQSPINNPPVIATLLPPSPDTFRRDKSNGIGAEEGSHEISIPVARIRRFANQPRKRFNRKHLRELGESMAQETQILPIMVVRVTDDPEHDYELVDGERRWRAAEMMGFPLIKAVVKSREEIPSKQNQHTKSLVANFCREGHSHIEIATALIKEREAGKSPKELARMVGKSEVWVYSYLRLNNLEPSLKALLDPELPAEQQLGFQLATVLAGLPSNRQFDAYREVAGIKNLRLRLLKAKQIAQEIVVETGTGRKRTPIDDVTMIERAVPRIAGDAAMMGILNTRAFETLVQFRSPTIVDDLIAKIKESITCLEKLKGVIETARAAAYAMKCSP